MNKTSKILLILLVVVSVILSLFIYNSCNKKEVIIDDTDKIIETIDSLQIVDDNLQLQKDSIRERIDTVIKKIKENSDKHEKIANDIIINSPSDDYLFFSEYIRVNKERLDSMYNL